MRKTPTRRCRRMGTAGRSSSASGCAGTSARTSGLRPGSRATTTSTAATAHGTGAGRKRRPRCAAAQAQLAGADEIEIWGDGNQTRTFIHVDDCVRGTVMIMEGDLAEPVNLMTRSTPEPSPEDADDTRRAWPQLAPGPVSALLRAGRACRSHSVPELQQRTGHRFAPAVFVTGSLKAVVDHLAKRRLGRASMTADVVAKQVVGK